MHRNNFFKGILKARHHCDLYCLSGSLLQQNGIKLEVYFHAMDGFFDRIYIILIENVYF